jgi:hypothetical protein
MTTASKAKRAKVRKRANVPTSGKSPATKSTGAGKRSLVNGAVQATKRVGKARVAASKATKRVGKATAAKSAVTKAAKRVGKARENVGKARVAASKATKRVGTARENVGKARERVGKARVAKTAATKGTKRVGKARVAKATVAKATKRVAKVAKRGAGGKQSLRQTAKPAQVRGGEQVRKGTKTTSSPAAQPVAKSVGKGVGKGRSRVADTSKLRGERAGKGAQPAAKAERRRPQQLEFGFDNERSELAVLQKQHRGLLLQIAKKRALITVSKQASEELMRELTERVLPYREALFEITREVCDLRERLLESSGLPQLQLEKMRWVLDRLIAPLPVEEVMTQDLEHSMEEDVHREATDDDAVSDDAAVSNDDAVHGRTPQTDSETRQAQAATVGGQREAFRRSQRSQSKPVSNEADSQPASTGASSRTEAEANAVSGATSERVFGARDAAPSESAERDAQSSAKPTGDQSGALRTLFRKLAITYHPDRVQDEAEKAARTKIMKELTSAFESADLARLVELERTLAARTTTPSAPRETPERQKQQLVQANEELKRQLKDLASQLSQIKDDCPFTLDLRLRDPAQPARDELDQLVLNRHMEVERAAKTREFVAMFAAGRMRFSEFVEGPRHLRPLRD